MADDRERERPLAVSPSAGWSDLEEAPAGAPSDYSGETHVTAPARVYEANHAGGAEPTKVTWDIPGQAVVEWHLGPNEVILKTAGAGDLLVSPELLSAMNAAMEHAQRPQVRR